ncbi:SPFH domain-containing protein [Leptospira sp. GIMC2001]|uniref:SPFH domain-containing protein n=1 Tax=Leptospira sp. GIMC2001 TaxID=1513297 RepID=UPI00234924F6|nr:stomatin-like protein [Leptospira sp. GIMC2001]WCL47865.1 paraslipin [Leptospira sp. GIMC2001]
MDELTLIFWVPFLIYVAFKLYKSVRIVSAQEVIIVERFGKYKKSLRAGFHLLTPFIEIDAYYHTLKEQAIDVHPQTCITKDNVVVKVDGVLYMVVIDPVKASYGIEDYRFAAIQLAQTTMRAVIGTMDLDKTFEERSEINRRIVDAIDDVSERWGVRINRYEIVNIAPPASVMESMEKEKRAQINKEAQISLSRGDQESRINRSVGLKEELINKSEGEKQKRINEAEGKAQEIEALATSTAIGIAKVADALQATGGIEAMKLRISQDLINQFTKLGKDNTEVVLPVDLTNFTTTLDNLLGIKRNN